MTLSLVIPCFQEAEALEHVESILPALPGTELVFVDDGSTDATPHRLASLAALDPRVRVLTHPSNRGVGAAMRSGIAASRGEVVVVYDADLTYPLEDVRRLAGALGPGVDVATASPLGPGGRVEGVPWIRRRLTRGAHLAYRLVLGRRARGVPVFTCAFRAWRGDLVRSLAFSSDGFPAAAEMLGRALLAGARVVGVPSTLTARTRGQSKLRVGRTVRGHLCVLARLAWLRASGRGARGPQVTPE